MKKRLIIVVLLIILINIFVFSDYIVTNIYQYTILFIKNLFFYSFIIYIISSLLVDNDLLELLNPIYYVTIMSMISGFPSGILYTKELYDKKYISLDCANYLITFCHFPNPLFIIGSVSKIVGIKNSIFILLSIYISSFITSRFFKRNFTIQIDNNYKYNTNNITFINSLSNSVFKAFKTIILIYGISIFSLIVVLIIIKLINPTGIFYSLIMGFFDLTNGIFSTNLINNKRIRVYLILTFITFGSLNIHLQSKSICHNIVDYEYFIKGRIITTFLVISIHIVYSLLD